MNESEKLNPIHPGEILLEEFLKPMGLSQNQLALSIRDRRDASTRSSMASAVSPLIPRCVLRGTSKCRLNSGLACRWTTISIWRKMKSVNGSIVK